jgi:hypothetical protein
MTARTTKSCKISNQGVTINDSLVYSFDNERNNLEAIYEAFDVQYPKFFKMDNASKLCFLTTEILLQNVDLNSIDQNRRTVLIETKEGCIKADEDYYQSMQTTPSPAQFVYTLPNVMIGEICIRHKIKGENYCLIADSFDVKKQLNLITTLLSERAIICIHGWVKASQNTFTSELYLSYVD